MSYNPTNWVNGETPINDSNLNHIEQGIKDVADLSDAQESKIADIANNQIPEEYLQSSVDNYIANNQAGIATKTDVNNLDSKLSSEIVEIEGIFENGTKRLESNYVNGFVGADGSIEENPIVITQEELQPIATDEVIQIKAQEGFSYAISWYNNNQEMALRANKWYTETMEFPFTYSYYRLSIMKQGITLEDSNKITVTNIGYYPNRQEIKDSVEMLAGDTCFKATLEHVTTSNKFGYTSFDDLPLNKSVVIDTLLENSPSETDYQGLCATFKGLYEGSGSIQLFMSVRGNIYTRAKWSSAWKSWTKYAKSNEVNNIPNLITSFLKIGCIGDSLSSGESQYTDESGVKKLVDLYEHSWGQFMARQFGLSVINLSRGGLSTRTWLTDSKGLSEATKEGNECNAYIIGLGQNDRLKLGSEYLGSISDIDLNNCENNADTYYGNYAKIIQKMKEVQPKSKFFLLPDPIVSLSDSFNNAVVEIASLFDDCYFIDLTKYSAMYANGGYFEANKRGGHYNSVAYNYMGKLIGEAISTYMLNNPNEFLQVEFIGTEYEYTP